MRVRNVKFVFLLLVTLLSVTLHAQTPAWQWAVRGGGDGIPGSGGGAGSARDWIYEVVVDKDGNTYTCGAVANYPTFGTTAFNPPNANYGNRDFFLAKYNACGDLLWARVGGAPGDDVVTCMEVDEQGNIYCILTMPVSNVPGYIKTPALDTSFTYGYFFFTKFSTDGNLVSVVKYQERIGFDAGLTFLKSGQLQALAYTSNNSYTINGWHFPSYSTMFVRFDTTGTVVMSAVIDTLGPNPGGFAGTFTTDENDNTYFSGYTATDTSIKLLDSTFNTVPAQGSVLIRADKDLHVTAARTAYLVGGCNTINYRNGRLYTSGRNPDGAVFIGDTDTTTTNLNSIVTAYCLDTNLNIIWKKQPAVQTVISVTEVVSYPSNDGVYLAYQHRGTTEWDSITLSTPVNTFFLAGVRLDAVTGNVTGAWPLGGTASSSDYISIVRSDAGGNGIFAGNFSQNIHAGDDTIYANGTTISPDYFIVKWGLPCTDTLNSMDAPAAPAALVATAVSTTGIAVNWAGISGNYQGFNLYRSPNGNTGWQQITSNAHADFDYDDQGLTPGTTYWYKVAAYTATGGQGAFSNIDSATTLTGACTAAMAHTSAGSSHTFTVTGTGTAPYAYTWSNNGTAFNAAATATLSLTGAGSYNICATVTDANNCIATDCETIVVSSIDEPVIEQIELYPNPAKDVLYMGIAVNQGTPVEILVFDFTGRQALSTQRYAGNGKNLMTLYLDGLAVGVYQVQVKAGAFKWHGKFIKGEQ